MTIQLSGSLAAFGLADVLSLLAMGGRTAEVCVHGDGRQGLVRLVDGCVSSASDDSARAGMLRRLVAHRSLDVVDMAASLESDEPVRALVDAGIVEPGTAQRVAHEHSLDSVAALLGWSVGEFSVALVDRDPGDIGLRLPVDQLLDDARARQLDWDRVRGELPVAESVLALVPDVEQAPTLALEEWGVLARIDGHRSLAEVVRVAGPAHLVTSERLIDLLGRGLVRVLPAGPEVEEQLSRLLDGVDAGQPHAAVLAPLAVEEPSAGVSAAIDDAAAALQADGEVPAVDLLAVEAPAVEVPAVEVPAVVDHLALEVPPVEVPPVEAPAVEVPSVDVPLLASQPQTMAVAADAVTFEERFTFEPLPLVDPPAAGEFRFSGAELLAGPSLLSTDAGAAARLAPIETMALAPDVEPMDTPGLVPEPEPVGLAPQMQWAPGFEELARLAEEPPEPPAPRPAEDGLLTHLIAGVRGL